MKKLFLVLAVATLGFVACNNDSETKETETKDTTTIVTPAPDTNTVVVPDTNTVVVPDTTTKK